MGEARYTRTLMIYGKGYLVCEKGMGRRCNGVVGLGYVERCLRKGKSCEYELQACRRVYKLI